MGERTRLRPPLPFETQRSNSDHSTLLACLRVYATLRRSPQKPALLTPSEATENDVGTLTRGRRRTGQAEDHVSMVPPETRQARAPAAHSATTDRKNCLVRMGGGGERINLSHEFSNQPDPEGPAAVGKPVPACTQKGRKCGDQALVLSCISDPCLPRVFCMWIQGV